MYKVNRNHKQLTEQPLFCGTRRQLSQCRCNVDSNNMHLCEDGKELIAKNQSVTIHQETSMLLLYLLVYCPKPLFILSPKQQQIGKDSLSHFPQCTKIWCARILAFSSTIK